MLTSRLSGALWRTNSRSTQSYSTAAAATPEGASAASRPVRVNAQRLKRAKVRAYKDATQKILTERVDKYLKTKFTPTKYKKSKTMKMLDQFVGIYPVKYDVDESKLSNAEFAKEGLFAEVATSAQIWGVMPEFVPKFTPTINLVVKHDEATYIYRGNVLESIKTRAMPTIQYEAKENTMYTIMMVDPDIPIKDTAAEAWNHYTIVNVPGDKVDQGQVLSEWIPPAPPKDTGIHRYIWLVLEQTRPIASGTPSQSNTDFNRVINFHEFLKQHQLKPKGISFHRTQFDQDVADLYAGWGGSPTGFNKKDYRTTQIIKNQRYQSM